MGFTRILVVQPSEFDPPLALGQWLADAGAAVEVVLPVELPVDLDAYEALVVLGGDASALDDVQHPWLSKVRALLGQAVTRQLPTLTIGLGAQLLAMAAGGRVRNARKGPEAGTLLIAKRDVAAEDSLLGPLPLTPDVLQFHADEVSVLPPSGQLLASSPKCDNQAFRVGGCAYGLQFHIETTTDVVLDWLERQPEIAAAARAGQWEREHLDEFHAELAEVWQPVAERFVRLAETPPEQRRSSRHLPLV